MGISFDSHFFFAINLYIIETQYVPSLKYKIDTSISSDINR